MTRILFLIMLVCTFILLPIKTSAILNLDENGNPIKKEINNGEVTTMTTPEDTVSSDGSQGSVPSKDVCKDDGSGNVSSKDDCQSSGSVGSVPPNAGEIAPDTITSGGDRIEDIIDISAPAVDDASKATLGEMMKLTTAEGKNKKWVPVIIFGSGGVTIGVLGTLLVLSRRK